MVEVADIFRRYGPSYRQKFGSGMPLRHRQAMADIEQCRTERFGGHVFACETCHETGYSYHSCKTAIVLNVRMRPPSNGYLSSKPSCCQCPIF